ncbi:YcgL domain-containing protein [Marinicella pacifica]|nr:YcgL domain-containing protein [Marinicella pacifica]
MRCVVYRSNKKAGAYVYCKEGFSPSDLPDELQILLGLCEAVMTINLDEREKLAREDILKVRQNLNEHGYHLQMPPKESIGVINFG